MATDISTITTAEQLFAANMEQRCELIRGELVLMSPTGDHHGAITAFLTGSLWTFVRNNKLGTVFSGEPGYIIERDPDTVRAPDVAFTSTEKLARYGRTEKFMPYAPDLAVEVISPSDRPKQVEAKTKQWLAAGCAMVIVVDPKQRTVKQYFADGRVLSLTAADTLTGGNLLPGWELELKELFEE